jgi:transposase
MVNHPAFAAEQAARRASRGRSPGTERHLLAAAHRFAWADIPERYGPATTCANRFRRWGKIGVWDRIFEAVSKAYDGGLQMIDSSSIRVHHLRECTPADIAHQRSLLFRRRRAGFLGERLQNADRRDICRDLFLRRALADPGFSLYAEIQASMVTPPCRLFLGL